MTVISVVGTKATIRLDGDQTDLGSLTSVAGVSSYTFDARSVTEVDIIVTNDYQPGLSNPVSSYGGFLANSGITVNYFFDTKFNIATFNESGGANSAYATIKDNSGQDYYVEYNGDSTNWQAGLLYTNQTVQVCFTLDTMIDTDLGEVAVQDLAVGMMVRTRDNGFQPIRWIGMSPAKDRAVRIKAGALGNTRDLVVSPRHRMVLDGWQLAMLFQHDHALVTALELVNDSTILRDDMADVEYYHVMFDAHEIIYAEGAPTESFHPDQRSMGSMAHAAREEILALFPELADVTTTRAQAAPTLDPVQANYVARNLDAFVG